VASTEYIRAYMREYRQGLRRGWRKRVPGSRHSLREQRREAGLVRARLTILGAYLGIEEPIGPQAIPLGMRVCPGCDILTRRRDVCGFCGAERLRAGAAA
jgi:hypothetical protein